MSLTVASLLGLDPVTVRQTLAEITAMVQEANPTIDVKRGVIHDLVLYMESLLATATQTNIDRYNQARSLLEITADPTLADTDIVNSVLSMFRIDRKPGTTSVGRITLVMSRKNTFTIPAGGQFTANGQTFLAATVFTAQDDPALVVGPNDRYLLPLSDGTFAVTIDVTAADVGTAGRLVKDTLLQPVDTYTGFVKAYATSDFSGGSDIETNSQLLDRLLYGIAAKCLSNRINMDALLREQPTFAEVVADSIIGMGDPEMLRDRHWIWPTGGGGRMDWYVRTQEQVQRLTLTKTATYLGRNNDGTSTWQFSLGRDDVPGFYDVIQIKRLDSVSLGGYEISSETRSHDLTGQAWVPDIKTTDESAYSRYQTTTIQFIDTDTDVAGLTAGEATADYALTVRHMPLIADIQDFMSTRRVKPGAADLLVRAPVPCFVGLSFAVQRRATDQMPDVDEIARRLAHTVNTYGFTGRLPASLLTETVHTYLTGSSAISAIDMRGAIRRPDGTIKSLRSSETLVIPLEPDAMVTPRTVAFLLDPADVAIAVNVVSMPDV